MTQDKTDLDTLFDDKSLGSPERAIGFVLWRVFHRYQREVDRTLADIDLTHLQFTVLALAAWMARSADDVTQTGIARFGDIHVMQVSLILKALEAKTMIERARSTRDVRTKIVRVTPHGLRTLGLAFPAVIEVQRRLFGADGAPDGALLRMLLALDLPDA